MANGNNKRDLTAYVRIDGSGRVVAGSLILRKKKPKVGKWLEIQTYECCNPIPSSTTTTTTTVQSFSWIVETGSEYFSTCSNAGGTVTLYTGLETLAGQIAYTDASLTSTYPNGWFAFNDAVYTTDAGGFITSLGVMCTTTSTSTSTTTTL